MPDAEFSLSKDATAAWITKGRACIGLTSLFFTSRLLRLVLRPLDFVLLH